MTFARIKQVLLRTGEILLLGVILFRFEPVFFHGILYGADPLPSTAAPLRYKIPAISPSPQESTALPDTQSQPEQTAVSTSSSQSSNPPGTAQPTSVTDDQSPDKAGPPPLVAGDQQKGEKEPVSAVSKTKTKTASKSMTGARLKGEPLSSKTSTVSGSSRKILKIVPDLTSPPAEMITIVLTGFFPPETQVIEGKTPKIICDFPNVLMERTIKRMIPINGKYVLQVRTGIHPQPEPKSRVVIDLVPSHDYEVEQLFYEKDNRYSMIIREKL